jgi:signal transduction histidine kinase
MTRNADEARRRKLARGVRPFRWLPVPASLSPLRIAVVYALFGVLALYVSDVLFVRYLTDPLLGRVQAAKGGVEVALTAGLIFALTRRYRRQFERANDRAERQREELQVLHRVLRHNLRNDLNVVLGYADTVRRSGSFRSECERIVETAERMVGYTDQARRIDAVTEGGGHSQRFDLASLLPGLLATHPALSESVDVTTDLPEAAPVEANRMFPEALRELVENAVVHNDREAQSVVVEVSPDDGPAGTTEIRVVDDGPGIPGAELVPLREHTEDGLVHLSGMGLWFVHWTVDSSDGDLAFLRNEDRGTTVRIRVPTATDASFPSP